MVLMLGEISPSLKSDGESREKDYLGFLLQSDTETILVLLFLLITDPL